MIKWIVTTKPFKGRYEVLGMFDKEESARDFKHFTLATAVTSWNLADGIFELREDNHNQYVMVSTKPTFWQKVKFLFCSTATVEGFGNPDPKKSQLSIRFD